MAAALSRRQAFCAGRVSRSQTVVVRAATWQKATSKSALSAAGGKQVRQPGLVESSRPLTCLQPSGSLCKHIGAEIVANTAPVGLYSYAVAGCGGAAAFHNTEQLTAIPAVGDTCVVRHTCQQYAQEAARPGRDYPGSSTAAVVGQHGITPLWRF